MRFGNFMAPFHPTGQNPTLAIERASHAIGKAIHDHAAERDAKQISG